MKMSAPIIITLPNKYLSMDVGNSNVEFADVGSAAAASRKRRLDHLSWEEKMQRKKLKNRVAAQTSRDRKKAKMDLMEARIEGLEEMNEKLMSEMSSMKALNERLVSENESLRATAAARGVVRADPVRPAASTNPRQKEGSASTAARAARLVLTLSYLLSQMNSQKTPQKSTSIALSNLLRASSERLTEKTKINQLSMTFNQDNAQKVRDWWGPHQSTWNPLEVHT